MRPNRAGRPAAHRLEFNAPELRRRVRAAQIEHTAERASERDELARLLDEPHAEGSADPAVTGPFGLLSRRRLIGIGGLALLWPVAASCTPSTSNKPGGGAPSSSTDSSTTTTVPVNPDVAILRLSSSLEHAVIAVYQRVSGMELVKNQALLDATTYFSTQHADHAGMFQGLTAERGGQVFADPNQAILDSLEARMAALTSEAEAVKLVYDVEAMAAATYFSVVGTFKDTRLNATTMSVAAVEGRHVAVLGMVLSGIPKPTPGIAVRSDSLPAPTQGFQTAGGAISPGTGI